MKNLKKAIAEFEKTGKTVQALHLPTEMLQQLGQVNPHDTLGILSSLILQLGKLHVGKALKKGTTGQQKGTPVTIYLYSKEFKIE